MGMSVNNTIINSTSDNFACALRVPVGAVITTPLVFTPICTDLTKAFGADNEPTTIEEFYARIPSGVDITAYNEGEIINLNTEAIKTVGFNQFNGSYARVIFGETYYLGGTYTNIGFTTEIGGVTQDITIPKDKLYKATQDGYIYAEGTDICINLSHTGWKNGTYEPYREFTLELPVIKKYFPDGMKKAGDVCDSIEWDSSKQKWVAVQRIGEIDLGSLSWGYLLSLGHFYSGTSISNSINLGGIICPQYASYYGPTAKMPNKSITISPYYGDKQVGIKDTDFTDVATFKTYLSENKVVAYYELAEPIVTEIEDEYVNFDYYVEDFGTEEAISSVASAPFSADIVYQFNAVDRIRDNDRKVEALESQFSNIISNTDLREGILTNEALNRLIVSGGFHYYHNSNEGPNYNTIIISESTFVPGSNNAIVV